MERAALIDTKQKTPLNHDPSTASATAQGRGISHAGAMGKNAWRKETAAERNAYFPPTMVMNITVTTAWVAASFRGRRSTPVRAVTM